MNHERTPYKAYGECPKLMGIITYDEDRTAKVRLCDIARHPRIMNPSENVMVEHLLKVFRRFTLFEAQKIGRLFVRKRHNRSPVTPVKPEEKVHGIELGNTDDDTGAGSVSAPINTGRLSAEDFAKLEQGRKMLRKMK